MGDSRIDERRRHAGLGLADCALQRLPHESLGVCPLVGGRLAALRRCMLCVCVRLCNRCRSLTRSACSSSCSGTATISSRRFLRKLPFFAFPPQRCSRLDVLLVARALVAAYLLWSFVRGNPQESQRSGARNGTQWRTHRCALTVDRSFALEALPPMHAYQQRGACCTLRCILRTAACCKLRVALRGRAAVCALHAERYVRAAWSPRCVYRTDRQTDSAKSTSVTAGAQSALTRFGCACCGTRQRGDDNNNNGSDRWRVAALMDGLIDGLVLAGHVDSEALLGSFGLLLKGHSTAMECTVRSGMTAAAHAACYSRAISGVFYI